MRSRRDHGNEALYWPAFADIMTVLVVVLLCMFAAIGMSPQKPPEPTPPTIRTGRDPGKTLPEFEATVLADRRRCVSKELRASGGTTFNEAFQLRLCNFKAGSNVPENPNTCMATLENLNETFTHLPRLELLESRYSVRFGRLYLRASTGLGSAKQTGCRDQQSDQQPS